MPVLTSRDHPLIKQLIKLESSAAYRNKTGLTLLDGEHLLQTYLAHIGVPTHVIVSESYAESALDALFHRNKLPKISIVSDALLRAVAPVKTPTGILALIEKPKESQNQGAGDFYALLEDIQDPGNLGSILRSAAAAGISDVYLSKHCADAWSPKTLRAAMGAHFFVHLYEDCHLPQVARQFQGKVVATSLQAPQSLFAISLTGAVAFVFGNEGAGLSHELIQATNVQISIPMPGKTESLNAAAAAAICFFEKVRQDYVASGYPIGT